MGTNARGDERKGMFTSGEIAWIACSSKLAIEDADMHSQGA